MRTAAWLVFLLIASPAGSAQGGRPAPKLHGLFGDSMVLQREVACPVWGTATPGEPVTVRISGQTKTTEAGADGRWSVKLDPLPAGGPHELQVNDLTVRDVLIGDVWLASGGSNMEMPVKAAPIAKTEPDEGPVPMVRFFVVPRREEEEPRKDVEGAWKTNRSDAVADVSALGYFFARDLQRRIRVPVGFLQAAAADSKPDAWIGKHALGMTPGMRRATVLHGMQKANYDIAYGRYLGSVMKAEEAKAKGEPVPPILPKPPKPEGTSALYNGMIAPLIPFALKGAICAQGEAEIWRSPTYEILFPGLIQSWRADWGLGDFPFGFLQLPNLGARRDEPEETWLPRVRDAQMRALEVPGTGMAVSIDLGQGGEATFRNTEVAGVRLALWAEGKVYGKSELVTSGPTFESMRIEGSRVRIKFKNTGSGLKAVGEKLVGFQMAGDFRRFCWASAVIEGNSVVVSCDDVKWPAAVRYAYADNPECNLFNIEGLPAIPFRTDSW
jgi:sialate O-acetylesterase